MVFFLGWVTTGWAADHVKGDGKLTSKKISVADYNEIKVDGVIDFNYEQSDDPSTVEVTVDQNLHPYVNIEVKDRVLTIAFKGAKVDHFTKFIVKTNSKWLAAAKVSVFCLIRAESTTFIVKTTNSSDDFCTFFTRNLQNPGQISPICFFQTGSGHGTIVL